jgi:hypothetical protein
MTEASSVNHAPSPNAAILKRTPSIDSGSDDSGDNSADLPDNFHSNPSDRGDYHDEPTDVDPPSTNPRAQTMAIVQCQA